MYPKIERKESLYEVQINLEKDIFDAVMELQSESTVQLVNEWIAELEELTAKEKLIGILKKNMFNDQVHSLDDVLAPRIQSPLHTSWK